MRSRPDNVLTLYLVLWEVLVQAWREGGKRGGEEDDSVAYFTTFEAPLGAGLIRASSMYEQSTNHIPDKKGLDAKSLPCARHIFVNTKPREHLLSL